MKWLPQQVSIYPLFFFNFLSKHFYIAGSWLENASFTQQTIEENSSSNEDVQFVGKTKTKKSKKKHHKEKHCRNEVGLELLASGDSNYYLDRKPLKAYLTVDTIRKPGCPRYHRSENYRFSRFEYFNQPKYKRYYKAVKKLLVKESINKYDKSEEDADLEYQKYLKSNSKDVAKWLKYISFKDSVQTSMDSYQKEKAKLEIAEKAMKLNPECDALLRKYLELLPKVYPTDEVLEVVERMINKNPNNFLNWNALIYNKQSSMAQCIVPDVLQSYQKCMRALFSVVKNDEILVKIFKNCALFLRQSGLWEQFFGTLTLALNLNVSTTAFSSTSKYFTSVENNTTLIEYEELILKSGLPLNEIWLRIEKLRSAYNFLPCITADLKSDPQRIVLNDDICGLVFPLMNKNYNFDLFILILRMLKYPLNESFFQRSSFFTNEVYENDSIEDILPTFLELKRDSTFDLILYSIIKEIQVPPSYLNSNLAHTLFRDMLFEIILAGVTCFNPKQNLILFKLYIQLERMLVVLEKVSTKEASLAPEFKKKVKSRIKKAIKNLNYQTNLLIYEEYAYVEYELDDFEAAQAVFQTIIQQNFIDSNEFRGLCLSYVELLIAESENKKAIEILTGVVLGKVSFDQEVIEIQSTRKLLVLQKLSESLQEIVNLETSSDVFEIEDYFLRSKLLLSIKCKIYYTTLVKSVNEAVSDLRNLIIKFSEKNQKHTFLREKIYELAAFLYNTVGERHKLLLEFAQQGLQELPQNLTLLRLIVTDLNTSWMNIKIKVSKTLTTNSVIFLIAACKFRCAQYSVYDGNASEEAYKKRVISLLETATDKRSNIRQNALLWRLYLRALFEVNSNQTLLKCRNTLYEALDVCPWNKALYLDGAFFSPQELSQLMDLIIEKQLRVHAIPEELQILRDK